MAWFDVFPTATGAGVSTKTQSDTLTHTESFLWDNLIISCTGKPDWPHWLSPSSYSSMAKCCSSQWKSHNTIFLTIKHQVLGTPASEAEGTIDNLIQSIKKLHQIHSVNDAEQQSRAHRECLAGSDKSVACCARATGFQPTLWINFQPSLCRYNTHGIASLSFSIHLPDLDTLTSTRPPLNGGDSGAVEDELLRRGVISGCSFQTPKMSPWK